MSLLKIIFNSSFDHTIVQSKRCFLLVLMLVVVSEEIMLVAALFIEIPFLLLILLAFERLLVVVLFFRKPFFMSLASSATSNPFSLSKRLHFCNFGSFFNVDDELLEFVLRELEILSIVLFRIKLKIEQIFPSIDWTSFRNFLWSQK